MSTSVTGTAIRDEVRRRCNLPAFTTNTTISLDDVASMIVDSGADLSGKLRKLNDNHFLSRTTITTTANVPSASLSSLTPPFFDLRRVALERSSTDIAPLERGSVDAWDDEGTDAQSWGSLNPTYQLFGQAIHFWPTPNSAFTLRIYYDSGIVFTTALTESIQMSPGWKEWIVLDVCHKVRQRLGQHELANNHGGERDSVYENLIAKSGPRDQWKPHQVRDLRDGVISRYPRGWRIP